MISINRSIDQSINQSIIGNIPIEDVPYGGAYGGDDIDEHPLHLDDEGVGQGSGVRGWGQGVGVHLDEVEPLEMSWQWRGVHGGVGGHE